MPLSSSYTLQWRHTGPLPFFHRSPNISSTSSRTLLSYSYQALSRRVPVKKHFCPTSKCFNTVLRRFIPTFLCDFLPPAQRLRLCFYTLIKFGLVTFWDWPYISSIGHRKLRCWQNHEWSDRSCNGGINEKDGLQLLIPSVVQYLHANKILLIIVQTCAQAAKYFFN